MSDIEVDQVEMQGDIGATSQSMQSADSDSASSRLGWLTNITVYEAMLLMSAASISLAIVLLMMELMSFENGIFFQWRTEESFVEPLSPL